MENTKIMYSFQNLNRKKIPFNCISFGKPPNFLSVSTKAYVILFPKAIWRPLNLYYFHKFPGGINGQVTGQCSRKANFQYQRSIQPPLQPVTSRTASSLPLSIRNNFFWRNNFIAWPKWPYSNSCKLGNTEENVGLKNASLLKVLVTMYLKLWL